MGVLRPDNGDLGELCLEPEGPSDFGERGPSRGDPNSEDLTLARSSRGDFGELGSDLYEVASIAGDAGGELRSDLGESMELADL